MSDLSILKMKGQCPQGGWHEIDCPICGNRDRREFYYQGDAVRWRALRRMRVQALGTTMCICATTRRARRGICGITRRAVGAWLVVTRDTVTHAVSRRQLAST